MEIFNSLNNFELFLLWYILGLILSIIFTMKTKGVLTIGDIKEDMVIALGGPILIGLFIMVLLIKYIQSLNNDMVLWRSKSNKTKHILFGREDDN